MNRQPPSLPQLQQEIAAMADMPRTPRANLKPLLQVLWYGVVALWMLVGIGGYFTIRAIMIEYTVRTKIAELGEKLEKNGLKAGPFEMNTEDKLKANYDRRLKQIQDSYDQSLKEFMKDMKAETDKRLNDWMERRK